MGKLVCTLESQATFGAPMPIKKKRLKYFIDFPSYLIYLNTFQFFPDYHPINFEKKTSFSQFVALSFPFSSFSLQIVRQYHEVLSSVLLHTEIHIVLFNGGNESEVAHSTTTSTRGSSFLNNIPIFRTHHHLQSPKTEIESLNFCYHSSSNKR